MARLRVPDVIVAVMPFLPVEVDAGAGDVVVRVSGLGVGLARAEEAKFRDRWEETDALLGSGGAGGGE